MVDIPVFVVNLERDTARRESILKECRKYAIEPEIINAVYGKSLTDEELSVMVMDHEENGLTRGEIGCSLSHISIYNRMVHDSIPIALVLEDDAVIGDGILEAIRDIVEFNRTTDKPSIYHMGQPKAYIKSFPTRLESITLYPIFRSDLTHGYMINLKAAEKLSKFLFPVRFTADDWKYFKYTQNICIYNVVPHPVFVLSDNTTSIHDRDDMRKKRKKYYTKIKT